MEAPTKKLDDELGFIKEHGLSIGMSIVFLSGEMAGSGVLALPRAIVGTGPGGLAFIVFFALISVFVGTRLGKCWIMLEERYPELRSQVRDPYPLIAEKAVGKYGRLAALICITLTLYGTGSVYIVLMSGFLQNLMFEAGVEINTCVWMVIVAAAMIPFTLLGTPNDLWPVAVGALITTISACVMVSVQIFNEVSDTSSCIYKNNEKWEAEYPKPELEGFFKAFSSIMFAYAGASTFPTIQADMKDRRRFPLAALAAITVLFCIYFPVASIGYFKLGSSVMNNVVESLCDGTLKIIVEVLLLLHLISVFPIMLNPPNQFLEELLKIPKKFNIWRCVFRTFIVFLLLFIAETLPNFGSILDLIGGSTITLLTFVFPPFFYMRLVDMSSSNKSWVKRELPTYERVICWTVIVVGFCGGALATYNAVKNIVSSDFTPPCYVETLKENIGE